MRPFHLSFVVPDKEACKAFYVDLLGCALGRDNKTWFDVVFFGHQLTIHQASQTMPAYKIDHFGPLLSKSEWEELVSICEENKICFALKPIIKKQGMEDESGKFMIHDPCGNTLEFKYYLNFHSTVG